MLLPKVKRETFYNLIHKYENDNEENSDEYFIDECRRVLSKDNPVLLETIETYYNNEIKNNYHHYDSDYNPVTEEILNHIYVVVFLIYSALESQAKADNLNNLLE